jgi:hypothetical protein
MFGAFADPTVDLPQAGGPARAPVFPAPFSCPAARVKIASFALSNAKTEMRPISMPVPSIVSIWYHQ